jgi:hypothetical protein
MSQTVTTPGVRSSVVTPTTATDLPSGENATPDTCAGPPRSLAFSTPEGISHSWMVFESVAVATDFPSGAKATCAGPSSLRVSTTAPVVASTSSAVASRPASAMSRPSGENPTEVTGRVNRVEKSSFLVSISMTFAKPDGGLGFPPTVATRLPSGESAMAYTSLLVPESTIGLGAYRTRVAAYSACTTGGFDGVGSSCWITNPEVTTRTDQTSTAFMSASWKPTPRRKGLATWFRHDHEDRSREGFHSINRLSLAL